MVRHTDTEKTVEKESFIVTDPLKQQAGQARPGHMESHQGWSRGRRGNGKMWAQACRVVFVGRNEQGNVSKLSRFRVCFSK
jgi:hypothetical protein